MKTFVPLILLLLLGSNSLAGDKKVTQIVRVNEPVIIDGELDEQFWSTLVPCEGFIQNTPVAGGNSAERTEVRIAFDNEAIYVGAFMFDDRDSITKTLSQRDDVGNADWFAVVFDPYHAGTIGFAFVVTAAGVQVDELHQVENFDNAWNAVWKSGVQIKDDRWIAEFKIPFSALRFSEGNLNVWGINFGRGIRRHREESYWNFYDPRGINLISQLGEMNGLENVKSPLRLAFTPYVSGYIENYDGTTGYTANGGMDVKWGVNEAFTLDMTLVPDFGQVQFDNQVLNTSPFEVRFNERRQFFTEGTDLFNKPGSIFYSRRVGGRPFNYYNAGDDLDSNEAITENPAVTQLYNATKLSGRTKKGTGIGVFNAITANTYASVVDTISGESRKVKTNPLTNYNVFVIDQNLKNNSSIALTNTSVWRSGKTYDANTTALLADFYTKGQIYNYWAIGNFSNKFYEDSVSFGHQVLAGLEKRAGNLSGGLIYEEISSTYDPNDLGFNLLTNIRQFTYITRYNWFEPFGRFYKAWSNFSAVHRRIRKPDAYSYFALSLDLGGAFRNYLWAGFSLYAEPTRLHDYFEPRVQGRFYESDALIAPEFFVSSNYGKPFAYDIRVTWYEFFEPQRNGFNLYLSPRIRFNDKWFLVMEYEHNNAYNEEGVALTQLFEVPFDPDFPDDPVFAKRDRVTVTNTIDLSYIINNKMGVTFRLRHYWSKLDYNSFFRLNCEGKMVPTNYSGVDINDHSIHNNSYNAFTIDMAYRWIFARGSELSLVWKNSIFSFDDQVKNNYFENVGSMLNNPALNSISLKVLYYIDYWSLRQQFSKNRKAKNQLEP